MITMQELLMWLLARQLFICCLYERLHWAICQVLDGCHPEVAAYRR
jgi:hypothetical protein